MKSGLWKLSINSSDMLEKIILLLLYCFFIIPIITTDSSSIIAIIWSMKTWLPNYPCA